MRCMPSSTGRKTHPTFKLHVLRFLLRPALAGADASRQPRAACARCQRPWRASAHQTAAPARAADGSAPRTPRCAAASRCCGPPARQSACVHWPAQHPTLPEPGSILSHADPLLLTTLPHMCYNLLSRCTLFVRVEKTLECHRCHHNLLNQHMATTGLARAWTPNLGGARELKPSSPCNKQHAAHPLQHLLEGALAPRAHPPRRLPVGNAALNATALLHNS